MSIEIGEGRRAHQGESAAPPAPVARTIATRSALVAAACDFRLLLIALWLGAAVFFSAAVAPSAFAVLRSFHLPNANEIAGTIVTRTLAVVNTGGFLIASVLLASAFLFRRAVRRGALLAETLSLAVVAILCGAGQWIIAARMLRLRAAMGRPVDEVAQNDPLRTAFNSLHGYSVAALGIAILAGALALLLIARRSRASSFSA
ncbi:MAG TPA: DUF4149 domain-containing protein [Pyrinomonadaceae bacterium]|jgi:hypothetical protein|nr:DUF4149 domain-containing protein [Pyrinomonadaceae bacterium]